MRPMNNTKTKLNSSKYKMNSYKNKLNSKKKSFLSMLLAQCNNNVKFKSLSNKLQKNEQ